MLRNEGFSIRRCVSNCPLLCADSAPKSKAKQIGPYRIRAESKGAEGFVKLQEATVQFSSVRFGWGARCVRQFGLGPRKFFVDDTTMRALQMTVSKKWREWKAKGRRRGKGHGE